MSRTAAEPGIVHFQCLGPVVLTGPDGSPLGLRTRKQLGLLFYLARRRRPVARDELIDLFWSQDTEKLARHSLSQCCSLINKSLGAEVIASAGRDRLAVREGSIRLDVNDFERLVADGEYGEAIGLWRGVLFEGLWVQRAPQFERWLTDEREKLQRLYRRLAHARIEALRHAGDHQAMRDEADRLLQHDPLDEKAMHANLEALTLLGDRSLALRRYGEFEGRLRRELDAEPGASLRGWARRTRKAEGPPPAQGRLPAPRISEITVLPAVQPFFGRTEEFGMLWKAWETAGTGKGAFIIIEGEAGIGKTALATKLVNQAHVAGGSVCFVKCYRTEKSVPFAPITALIRQLSRLPGFVALDPVWIGELTRLVPELRERYPSAPPPMAVDDAARHRLSDAAVNAALSVADEQPLMIVVDDLHGSDESSLALLHYLGRQTPTQAVLLIGIVRTEAPLTEFERTFFMTARVAGFGSTLVVDALPSKDIERLIEQVLARRGLGANPWLVGRIANSCRGNPLAALEAAFASRHDEAPVQRLDSHEKSVTRLEHQEPFLHTAAARFSSLTSEARLVAQGVAIAGRPLSEYELGVVTRLGPAELAAAINCLEDAHFVRRLGPSVAFAHEQYASAVEQNLDDRASDLHLSLAHLTARSAATNPAMRYEAARHYLAAGRTSEAREQSVAAVEYAGSVGAVRGKADALKLLQALDNGLSASHLHDLCACYLHLNDLAPLRALCTSSVASGGSIAKEVSYYEIAADYQSGLGFSEVESLLEAYLRDATTGSHCRLDAQVLLLRIAEKTGHVKRVRSVARALRRETQGAHALFGAAYVALKFYWAAKALPLMTRALEMARAEGELEIEQLARDGIGILLKQVGRYRDSIRQFDFSLGLARKTMNPHAEVACIHNRAVSELALGAWESVRASHAEADRIGASFARWGFHLFRTYNDSIVELCSGGDLERALYGFNATYEGCVQYGFRSLARDAKAGAALVHERQGDLIGLHDAVAIMRELIKDQELALTWINDVADAYERALNENEPDAALLLLARRSRELERRDVSHQLALDFERIRITEAVSGKRAINERALLAAKAERYEANGLLFQLSQASGA